MSDAVSTGGGTARLAAEIARRRARERRIRALWFAAIWVGVAFGGIAFFDAEHAGSVIVSGVAALMVITGIMAWTSNHVYASRTERMERRLSDAQQRRDSAGFAAQFDDE